MLVVASPPEERSRLGAWLEEAGMTVLTCPGPRVGVPCVGMLGHCPLAEDADAVVLDPLLEQDPLLGTAPGLRVLDVYLRMGLGVALVVGRSEPPGVRERPGVVPIARPVEYGALEAAVLEALVRRRARGTGRREGGTS